MTRRKKPEGAVRNHLVTVRLNDSEYSAVCDSAKEAGLSLSDYFRHQGVYGKVEIHNQIVADFPKLEKLAQEFSAIGNNLNQREQPEPADKVFPYGRTEIAGDDRRADPLHQ